MKQVLIINRYIPHYRLDFFKRLKEALQDNHIELHLVTSHSSSEDSLKKDELFVDWAEYIPYKQIRIGKGSMYWQPYFKQVQNKDLVIVESANKLLLNYYLLLAKHWSRFKLAFWGHGRNMQIKARSYRNTFKDLFLTKADWWFGYTSGVKDLLLTKNFPESRITVVQNAIDTVELRKHYLDIPEAEVDQLKDQLHIKGKATAIFCGGMYSEKRLGFVLDVCYKVKSDLPEFSMLFIGSGIDSKKIEEASARHDWIHYLGPQLGNERIKYFKLASVQLMPGLVGLGILDSFAMECPIVTTDYPYHSPEIEYLIDDYNGIISEDNVDAYSNRLVSLLQNGEYETLIEGCKDSAEKYTLEIMVENFKNGIISCLES